MDGSSACAAIHGVGSYYYTLSPCRSSDTYVSLDAFSDCPTSVACLDPCSSSEPYRPIHRWKARALSFPAMYGTWSQVDTIRTASRDKSVHVHANSCVGVHCCTRFLWTIFQLHGGYNYVQLYVNLKKLYGNFSFIYCTSH